MKAQPTYQKLRGGYYTPSPITDFITRWAIKSKDTTLLEPSCGDGNFLESSVKLFQEYGADNTEILRNLNAIEFDIEEAKKANNRVKDLVNTNEDSIVSNGDFFSHCTDFLNRGITFDAIVGNPPFIRYQNFLEEHREIAFELMFRAGLKPNRLTNSWVPFLIASSLLLKSGGKLGMVIPAELFQVGYAAQTRQFLSDYFSKITIITFQKLVFDDIQQEVILLLCEKNEANVSSIKVVELDDIGDLNTFDIESLSQVEAKPMDHTSEKWTQYFLSTPDIQFLRELRNNPKVIISRDVIDVDVGVVSGLNQYFVLSEEELRENKLNKYTQRIVTRSAHLEGAIFKESDWNLNVSKQYPTFLFYPDSKPFEEQPVEVKNYISYGEQEGVNQGYKCRIRKKWFVVPSVWVPEAFMLRQVHGYPKIILNDVGATCTDTIHRVRFKDGYEGKYVAAAFLNSLTLAFSEVVGRSYGGGVLTFEPSESENLPLPLNGYEKLDIEQIDKLIRENRIEEVLDITDKVLLVEGLGLTENEALTLRNIWKKLRDRRINRKRSKKKSK